ncbi:hypothetical protein A9K55_008317 [Cordyceps militaris]|uniref:P-loop containing nucleoside triphosphate hydrolase n=1 Tax=Cordyceps militaris TaxID=73501 RepID=A0A2H4SHE4_CORMI|nr:hypothetical protein A9K55_008317 [Cordyceps militaris]
MTEAQAGIQPLLLITYPRSASNLLVKVLNLPAQPNVVSVERGGLFFHPAAASMNSAGLLHRPHARWSEAETETLQQKYQSSYDALQSLLDAAEQHGKMAVVREHAPFITSPHAVSAFLHVSPSDTALWRVEIPPRYRDAACPPGLPPSLSVLPEEFLLRCQPAFLIRHPALAFPSYYRLAQSFCDGDLARMEKEMVPFAALSSTLRWTRQLYDWYTAAWTALGQEDKKPVIIDADDMLRSPEVVLRFCDAVGLDQEKAQFHWEPLTEEERTALDPVRTKTCGTLHSSSGIARGKSFEGLTMAGEAEKWKAEFGEQIGQRIEGWVRAAMPDYDYLVGKKLHS